MRADAIHYLRTKLSFANPFLDVTGAYFYSFVLVAWEPTPAQTPPRWTPLEPPATAEDAERLRVRRCGVCGKSRILPRHQSEPTAPFVCSALADSSVASCDAPCHVWRS